MTIATANMSVSPAQRIEELGRIIMAYSEVTERLQQSHEKLQETVDRAARRTGGEKSTFRTEESAGGIGGNGRGDGA